jgi:hypothetical protein
MESSLCIFYDVIPILNGGNVLCDGGIGTDAVPIHESDQFDFCEGLRRCRSTFFE